MEPVHYVGYAAQGDLTIWCDDSETEVAWNQPKDLPEHVHLTDDKRLYTFERPLVTCTACRAKPSEMD